MRKAIISALILIGWTLMLVFPNLSAAAANGIPVMQPVAKSKETAGVNDRNQPVLQTKKTLVIHKTVIESFRSYRKERTIDDFIALFDAEPLLGIHQVPKIVIPDGIATVLISFVSGPGWSRTPEITGQGGALISIQQDKEATNKWNIFFRPAKGAIAASLTIPLPGIVVEYPLALVQQADLDLNRSGAVTEADFKLFLQGRAMGTPRWDLNRDGNSDYFDDYVFTANFLLSRNEQKEPAGEKRLPADAPLGLEVGEQVEFFPPDDVPPMEEELLPQGDFPQ